MSELSYNSTTDESDADKDVDGDSNNRAAGHRPGDHARTKNIEGPRSSSKKNNNAARVVPVVSTGSAPKRRMTFGGLRSDKRGEVRVATSVWVYPPSNLKHDGSGSVWGQLSVGLYRG